MSCSWAKTEIVAQARISRLQLFLKRCVDLLGAAVLILLLSPVFVIVGLLVMLEDRLPIIYRRRVIGITGQFDAFKFRSMRRDADSILASNPALKAEFERNFKLKNDPRVTRVGAFLRKLSLDELPQLFNVLRGEMSLVGPRMITAPELDKYGPHRQLLLTVKPGLTQAAPDTWAPLAADNWWTGAFRSRCWMISPQDRPKPFRMV